jgi:hypothetical protein
MGSCEGSFGNIQEEFAVRFLGSITVITGSHSSSAAEYGKDNGYCEVRATLKVPATRPVDEEDERYGCDG